MPGKQSTQESKRFPTIGSGTPASIQHLATFGGQASEFIREQINFLSTLSPGSRQTALYLFLPILCLLSFSNLLIRETIFHFSFALLWFIFPRIIYC